MNATELTVELQYFKRSGKYYTSGECKTTRKHLFDIWEDIKRMRTNGQALPGLSGSGHEFIILVNVPEHEFAHPYLIT